MYSFEGYGHIILLLFIIGVILTLYFYFSERHKKDENQSGSEL